MALKLSKKLNIRLSPEELAEISRQAEAFGAPVSFFARRVLFSCRGASAVGKKSQVHQADPALVRQVARIGSNLNQLARFANSGKAHSISILAHLVAIERALAGVLEMERK